MTTIIYDSTAKPGHNSEYIRHLIVYIKTSILETEETYVFILHPAVINKLGSDWVLANNVIVIPIQEVVCNRVAVPNSLYDKYKNSYIESYYINSQLRFFKAERLIFMVVDAELFTIRRVDSPSLIDVSGIYLRPLPPSVYTTDSPAIKVIQSLKRAIKISLIKYFLNAKKLKCIFILDDNNLVAFLQIIIRSIKFTYLPDPFSEPLLTNRHDSALLNKLGVKQAYFLAFGVMEPRKNLLNIIRAFHAFTHSSTTPDIDLLIVGKFVSDDYKREVTELIDQISLRENVHVIVHDRFLDDTERDLVIAQSEAIVMPYLNFQGSSGMLGHAVVHNKPAIVGSLGLVGELVNTYQLGISVNPGDIDQIGSAMQRALTFRLNGKLRDSFLHTRTPTIFSEIILNN